MSSKLFSLMMLTLLLAACGTAATPEWAAGVQETQVALAVTSEYETSIAPTVTPTHTLTPTPIPPTATPIPPTATSVPPTPTPEPPTATFTPSPIPDEAGGGEASAVSIEGDPEAGKVAFESMRSEVGFACATCHHVALTDRLIGPGLAGIGEQAATRVEGQSAAEYMYNSIVHPNDYIVEDATGVYPSNLMPQTYNEVLTEEELNNIIAYLLTL